MNKSKYQVAILKRKNLSNNKSRTKNFDIVICINSNHNKKFVIEKIGSINDNFLYINNFRFIYWLQFNLSFNIKACKIFYKYIYLLNKINC